MTSIVTRAARAPARVVSRLVTAPAQRLLTTAEAKAQLQVEHSADDSYIADLALTAEQYLDAERGVTGRALVNQTWLLAMDGAPDGAVPLPVTPVVSVTSILYDDADGEEQTFAAENYVLAGAPDRPEIVLAPGAAWPAVQNAPESFRITYLAGHGATGADAPAAARTAARLLLGHWYRHREAVAPGSAMTLPLGFEMLLAQLRAPRSLM